MVYEYSIKNTWHPIIHREKKGKITFNSKEEIEAWLSYVQDKLVLKHNVGVVSSQVDAMFQHWVVVMVGADNRYEIILTKLVK